MVKRRGGGKKKSEHWVCGVFVLEGKRALVKVPFAAMTKGERKQSSLNGTDEWLWKQHLICIEGDRGLFVGSPRGALPRKRNEIAAETRGELEGNSTRPWLFSW